MPIATGEKALAADVAGGKSLASGMIVIWAGTIANIPSGFVICDGNNGTPNLLARFVQGVATAATNPGATGGATAKTTTGHTHTGPSHTHAVNVNQSPVNAGAGGGETDHAKKATYTSAAGGTEATGSKTDAISDIRLLFYDVAFLMKT